MKLVAILQTATEKIDEDHPSQGKNMERAGWQTQLRVYYVQLAVNRQPGYRQKIRRAS